MEDAKSLDDLERDLRSGMGFSPIALSQTADSISGLRAEIARLTAALAEAEARGYARAMEDAAIICEALNDKRLSGASGDFIASLASQRIRALAKKEAGAVFPPPHCTAWEDCNHDGICHDPKCCGATGPNHEAFYGEAGE